MNIPNGLLVSQTANMHLTPEQNIIASYLQAKFPSISKVEPIILESNADKLELDLYNAHKLYLCLEMDTLTVVLFDENKSAILPGYSNNLPVVQEWTGNLTDTIEALSSSDIYNSIKVTNCYFSYLTDASKVTKFIGFRITY